MSAVDQFEARYSRRRDRAESTARRYRSSLQQFCDWLEGRDADIWTAETEDVREFLDYLYTEGYAEDSITSSRSAISQFYQLMDTNREDNPVDDLVESWASTSNKEKETREEVYYLQPEEVEKLADNVPEPTLRNELIVKLLFVTGVRRGELAKIRLKDIGWSDRGEERVIRIWNQKDNSSRVVTYKNLDTQLRTWRDVKRPQVHGADESEYLFPTRQSEHISGETVRRVVKTAAENAGLQETYGKDAEGNERVLVSPHTLRHSFAVQCAKNGMRAPFLRDLLGHHDIDVTQIYLKLAEEDTIEAGHNYGPSI